MATVRGVGVPMPAMVLMLGASAFSPVLPTGPNAIEGLDTHTRRDLSAPSVTPPNWVPPWQKETDADPYRLISLEYISPSALETFDDQGAEGVGCEAKWGFAKLDRIEKGSSAAAELGSAMHSQHERWFLDGTPYDLTTRAGELALATDHLLPPRDTYGLRVEQEIRFQHPLLVASAGGALGPGEGPWFGGKIDLNWSQPSGAYVRPNEDPRTVRVVLDHKSTGEVKHAKLERQKLLEHPQAPMYAEMFFVGLGEERRKPDPVKVALGTENFRGTWHPWGVAPADLVELRWNYVTTKDKPKPFKSWHMLERPEAEHYFAQYVIRPARRMLQVVDEANAERRAGRTFGANQLRKNFNACSAFGGCAFKDRCGRTPLEGILSMSDPAQNSFFNRAGINPGAPGTPPQGSWTPPGQPPQGAPPPAQQAGPPQGAPGQGGYGWQNNVPPSAPPPQNGAPPGAWQPPQGATPPGPPQGYGGAVNPPEGQGVPQNGAPPGAWQPPQGAPPPAQQAQAPQNLPPPAPPPARGRPPADPAAAQAKKDAASGGSLESRLLAAVAGGLCAGAAVPLLQGQMDPNAIAGVAVQIVTGLLNTGVK